MSDRSMTDVIENLIRRLDTGNVASTALPSVTGGTGIAEQTGSIGKEIVNLVNPASSGGSTMTNVLTSLFLGPIWKGLFSIFSGGGEDPAPVLSKYQFPEAIATSRTASNASLTRVDALGTTQAMPAQPASIQVSIQALDARSILDRSDDIANALRQAMLSNHEINDNLSEL